MVFIEWLLILLLYISRPGQLNERTPLSDFLKFHSTHFVFILGFILVGIAFYIFVHRYLTNVMKVNTLLFDISLISLLAALLVPYNTNWGHTIHALSAALFALLFYSGVLYIGTMNKKHLIKIISFGSIGCLFLLMLYTVLVQGLSAILLYELFIGLTGQLWIICISIYGIKYLGDKR
jgi:uncharacterized membrane protein